MLKLMVASRSLSETFRRNISVLENEDELRDSALMLATAHWARAKLLSARNSRKSTLRSGRVVRRICNTEPTVHSEIIKFDREAGWGGAFRLSR